MTQDTLLLRLRAEALCANLRRLQGHLVKIPDRRKSLQELGDMLEKAQREVVSMRKTMIEVEPLQAEGSRRIEDAEAELAKMQARLASLDKTIEAVGSKLEFVKNGLKDVRSQIQNMKDRCFQVQNTSIAEEIQQGLTTSTGPVIQDVTNVEELLRDPPSDLAPLWARLQDAIRSKTEPVFADYVEFLGGVALRDAGFDEGISEVADELLRTYTTTGMKPNYLAIPTREQALVKTFARIIRVVFPEWTIWALPSTALEFWNAVASQNISKALDGSLTAADAKKIQTEDRDCLGDAYATFTMGPAYAYCAITLLLDPASDRDQRRTRAILTMLQSMDEKEGPLRPPYKRTRKDLLTAWNAARGQLGQEPLVLDVDLPQNADTTDPGGIGTRVLVRAFARVLANMTSAGFVVDVWNEIQPWVQHLIDDAPEEIQVPAGAELRHVLNAAWVARAHPERDPALDLTAAVHKLRDAVRQKGK